MNSQQNNGHGSEAVMYLRVSTPEQADPLNLKNQEDGCRRLAAQRGIAVTEVILGPGESGRTADRPSFVRLLSYCKAHRKRFGYVIVESLSRFARNVADQGAAIAELRENGITLLSVAEPNVDNTAAGRMAAGVHGVFNQYFSDALSEKMKDRSAASVRAGRWPWAAPLGYVNDLRLGSGANIKPDPSSAPLVREAFQLYATGHYTKIQVLKIVTDKGLKTKRGQKLTAQTFDAVLRKPIYAGWVYSSSVPAPVKGLHSPIVNQELFDAVQRVLSGRKLSSAPKRKQNPAFPLKHFVKCGICGTPLTGGMNKGKLKHYPNYWCRNADCRAVRISKPVLESEFVEYLGTLRPDAATVSQFPAIAAEVWARRQGDSSRTTKQLTSQLEEQKTLKAELLRARLRGEVCQADYAQANADFDDEIERITQQINTLRSQPGTLEAFLRFSKLMLVDISAAWQRANAEQRFRVQNFLFRDGLAYHQKQKFLNTPNPTLFQQLRALTHPKSAVGVPDGI
ncbi:MAG: recombinase family protein [Candidatus Sulfotelmatobacter sp.]